MSTTAALVEGHYFMTLPGMSERRARCQCGVEFEWNDAYKSHARHLFDVVRAAERERIAQAIETLPDVSIPGYFATRPGGYVTRTLAATIAREGA